MNKLLGLVVCVVACMALTLGSSGCKKDPAKPADKPGTAAVTIKTIPETNVEKGKKVTVAVELEADAPVALTAKASGTDVSGTATIDKDKKKADLEITTTSEVKNGTEVTVEIASTDKTKAATTTFKLKVN